MNIEGARINSKVVVHDDYIYRRNTSKKGSTQYLLCIKKSCNARANQKPNCEEIIITRNHNHKANRAEVEELLFKASCKRRAIETAVDLRTIFDEECARYPEGSRRITFSSFGGTLKKSRTTNRQGLPRTPGELNELLEMNTLLTLTGDEDEYSRQQFFRGMLQEGDGDGTAVVIFASETMTRDVLKNAKNIYMTVTTKKAHVTDMFLQLLTIHAETLNYIFPCVYALMTHNTEAAYSLVFEFVKAFLCTEMNPDNIVTDFEDSLQSSVAQSFPNAALSGHIHTYAQGIWQHLYKSGIVALAQKHPPTKKVIKFLIALPLLPPNRLLDGLKYIKKYAEDELAMQRSMSRLFEYVQQNWIENFGQKLSMCDQPERTNNFVEAFCDSLTLHAGKHNQNIWRFIEGLQQIELLERQSYQLLADNPVMDGIVDKTKPQITLEFEAIKNAVGRIKNGNCSLKEFFTVASPTASEHLSKAARDILREGDAEDVLSKTDSRDDLAEEGAQDDPMEGNPQDDSMSDIVDNSSSPTHFDHAYGANPGPSKVEVNPILPDEQMILINQEDMLAERPLSASPGEAQIPEVVTVMPRLTKMPKFVKAVAHIPQSLTPQTPKYVPTLANLPQSAKLVRSGSIIEQPQSGTVNMKCVCCKVRNKTVLFIPCRHLCCCQTCAEAIDRVQLNRKCPICQTRYLQTIPVIL